MFECPVCNQIFKRAWNLARHIRCKHTCNDNVIKVKNVNVRGGKPPVRSRHMKHECGKCKRIFQTKSELVMHKDLACYRVIKIFCRLCSFSLSLQ